MRHLMRKEKKSITAESYLQETKDPMLAMVREYNLQKKKKNSTLLESKQKPTEKNLASRA